MTKSIAKKSTTGSLPPAVPLAITPTFSPWTHTSDDSYIYQLSLVLATATVSFDVGSFVGGALIAAIRTAASRTVSIQYICRGRPRRGAWPLAVLLSV